MITAFRRPAISLIPTSWEDTGHIVHVIGTVGAVTAPKARFFEIGRNIFRRFDAGNILICYNPITMEVTGQVRCEDHGTLGVLPAYTVLPPKAWVSAEMPFWFKADKDAPIPLAVYAGQDVNTLPSRHREPDDDILPIAVTDAELVGVPGILLFDDRDHPVPEYEQDAFKVVTHDLTVHWNVGTSLSIDAFTHKVDERCVDLNAVMRFGDAHRLPRVA